MKTIALVGSPNCGKTTLFNAVTGLHQHVGNWAGVTVERTEGESVREGQKWLKWVDLPGVYALHPYSAEEKVTADFLSGGEYDEILQIIDATALERGLYLTRQLMRLSRPMTIALNMMDECQKRGLRIDARRLSALLGVRVLPISARDGQGIPALLEALQVPAKKLETPAEAPDAPEQLAAARYAWAETICQQVRQGNPETQTRTDAIDTLALHPVLALPIFAGLLGAMLLLSFGRVGNGLSGLLDTAMLSAQGRLDGALRQWQVADGLRRLLTEGLLTGVGSVISFLPMLLLLFACLSLLEDSGYMARAAFLMDRPMRALGLSGRSFIPLLLGFGCSVPAALSARAMRSQRDRRFTLLLIPLVSCSAKMPVFAALSTCVPGGAAAIFCLYAGGLLLAAGLAQILRRTVFPGEAAEFVMELPPYRLPLMRNVVRKVLRRTGEFLSRACTVILLSSMLVWAMGRLTWTGAWASRTTESIMGSIAGLLTPIFAPLGFGSVAVTAALMTGLLAKESIISTLAVLAGQGSIRAALASCLPTSASALSLMTFVLLYPPCAAASASIIKGLKSRKLSLLMLAGQFALAWGMAWLVYHLAN